MSGPLDDRLSASMSIRVEVEVDVGVWGADQSMTLLHKQVEREGIQILRNRLKNDGRIIGKPLVRAVTFYPFRDRVEAARDDRDGMLDAAVERAIVAYATTSGRACSTDAMRQAVIAAFDVLGEDVLGEDGR